MKIKNRPCPECGSKSGVKMINNLLYFNGSLISIYRCECSKCGSSNALWAESPELAIQFWNNYTKP